MFGLFDFGLICFIGFLIVLFGPKNFTNLIITWMITKGAERVADKFSPSPKKSSHNPHAETSFLDLLSLSPQEFEKFLRGSLREIVYHHVRWVGRSNDKRAFKRLYQ